MQSCHSRDSQLPARGDSLKVPASVQHLTQIFFASPSQAGYTFPGNQDCPQSSFFHSNHSNSRARGPKQGLQLKCTLLFMAWAQWLHSPGRQDGNCSVPRLGTGSCCSPEHPALLCSQQPQAWGSQYLMQTLAFGSTFPSQNGTNPATELICDLQNSWLSKTQSKQRKEMSLLKVVGIGCL